MRSYRILEAASVEAMEAAAWYEQEQKGLGAEFDAAVQAALDLLDEEIVPLLPFPGRAGEHGVRRLIMHTFPFDIVVVNRGSQRLVTRRRTDGALVRLVAPMSSMAALPEADAQLARFAAQLRPVLPAFVPE